MSALAIMAYPPAWTTTFRWGGAKHPALLDELGNLEACRIPAASIIGAVGGGVNDVALQGNTTQTADASGTLSISIGRNSTASGATSIAIGSDSNAANDTKASATDTVALGHVAIADHTGCVAIGKSALATGGVGDTSAVAVGDSTQANGAGALALGYNARATADNASAIGSSMVNANANSCLVGTNGASFVECSASTLRSYGRPLYSSTGIRLVLDSTNSDTTIAAADFGPNTYYTIPPGVWTNSRNRTLPTVAALLAAFPELRTDDSYLIYIANNQVSGVTRTMTFVSNTGWTLAGFAGAITQARMCTCLVVITSTGAQTATFYVS